jgi:hypothetical protein
VKHRTPLQARRIAPVLAAIATVAWVAVSGTGVAAADGGSGQQSGGQSGGAQQSGTVNVGATISGSGVDPAIACTWVLTDDNHGGGAETQQFSDTVNADIGPSGRGLSYTNYAQPSGSNGASGSSPNAPSFSPCSGQSFIYGEDDSHLSFAQNPPCDVPHDGSQAVTMAAGSQGSPTATGVQVVPNAFDQPAPRRLELWAATSGATSVTFNVLYPNGSQDTQAGGVELTSCQNYDSPGSQLADMFAAAGPWTETNGTNQVSSQAITNSAGTGIVDTCNEGTEGLWHQAITLSQDDPNGTYTVETIASNSSNGQAESWSSFYVIPFFDLEIDFNSLGFKNNGHNQYVISGSTTWAPPNSAQPTVTNGGNSGEQIGVTFSDLVYRPPHGPPVNISQFEANIGYNNSDMLAKPITGIAASTSPTYLGSNGPNTQAVGPQIVCPNDAARLDLTADPPSGAPAGTYTGTMVVWAKSDVLTGSGNMGCVTDNGAPYIVSTSSGKGFKTNTDQDQWPLVRS